MGCHALLQEIFLTQESSPHLLWLLLPGKPEKGYILFQHNLCKTFDCVDHNKLWKILKEMGIPDHLTCLLRNLYASQEATVRTGLVPNRKRSMSRLYIVTMLI